MSLKQYNDTMKSKCQMNKICYAKKNSLSFNWSDTGVKPIRCIRFQGFFTNTFYV